MAEKNGNSDKKQQEKTLGITVKKSQDFVEWYSQVVQKAELADYAPIHGCMIIRPNAYAIWEQIQNNFNAALDRHGVRNAYFPLLIPESFFKKEAEHAEGFAPELAWVEKKEGEERLAIRPTSETIMYDSFAKWVRSWRDLPLRINQWCNILRWEVSQTKPFVRTREFLWQEGHCVYETKEECDKEVLLFLEEYQKIAEELLAVPVIIGLKSRRETFAGALYTTTIESLMPDGKALQLGTSHNLGQGFAKAFGLKFLDRNAKEALPWQSSWGFSTRLIGALIMAHGDDKGLVLPPLVAKTKAVIVPIYFDDSKAKVLKKARELQKKLALLGVSLDDRDYASPGWKFNEWELKGIPVRIELGPKDLAKKQVVVVRRDTGEKKAIKESALAKALPKLFEEIQASLFNRAKRFLKENTVEAASEAEFKKAIENKKMVFGYFCEREACEEKLKEELAATVRCIPFNQKQQAGKCAFCGSEAKLKAYFAKNY